MSGDISKRSSDKSGTPWADCLAHAALTFAFWICLEISHARHVAADYAIDVLGVDAFRTLAARNASQHALHEVVIVLVAIGLEIEIGGAPWSAVRRRYA